MLTGIIWKLLIIDLRGRMQNPTRCFTNVWYDRVYLICDISPMIVFFHNLYKSHFVVIYVHVCYVELFVFCFQSSFIVFDTPSLKWDWAVPRGSEPSKTTRPKWVSIVTIGLSTTIPDRQWKFLIVFCFIFNCVKINVGQHF